MLDGLRRWSTVGSGLFELTWSAVERLLRELTTEGDVREEASTAARGVMDRTREDREELARALKSEVQNQMRSLGVATLGDVERLERKVDALGAALAGGGGGAKTARRRPTRKATARKATARKATARKETAPKTAARKATARKATARKTAGADGAAKRARKTSAAGAERKRAPRATTSGAEPGDGARRKPATGR